MRFYYATHILSLVTKSTLVVNDPLSLRDANEKLVALRFPQFCPDTLVTRSPGRARGVPTGAWRRDDRQASGRRGRRRDLPSRRGRPQHQRDPRDGDEGRHRDDHGAGLYIPEIREGDKRIILVEGEPKGAVLRVPQESEARANFHVGGTAHVTDLTVRDQEICSGVGPSLRDMGILFAGIDVIGDKLTRDQRHQPHGHP